MFWGPPTGGDKALGIVDFSIFPHVDHPDLAENTMAAAEKWAAALPNPAYAIDDDTAIRVVDVAEPQPFVLGRPPERTGSTIVQGDVDSVIADAVVVRVRQRRIGMLAVYGGCDVMVEGERVPGEAAVRPKRCRDPPEAAATIGPGGQMQQRPPRAVDQAG